MRRHFPSAAFLCEQTRTPQKKKHASFSLARISLSDKDQSEFVASQPPLGLFTVLPSSASLTLLSLQHLIRLCRRLMQHSCASPPVTAAAAGDIPSIFVRYLKATGAAERQAVARAHPLLFTDDIVAALADARAQINATLWEVQEACRMIDAVSGSLEFTGAKVELQPGESKALLDEDTILHNFATSLGGLLTAREKAGTAMPSTTLPVMSAPTSSGPCAAPASAVLDTAAAQQQWFTQPALVLAILAFLPAEEVFLQAENVCRAWQTWLFVPDVSRFFWVGCVQLQFPEQLQTLLKTAGDDLFQSDWRSLAMLCVAEAEGDDEAEEDAASAEADEKENAAEEAEGVHA